LIERTKRYGRWHATTHGSLGLDPDPALCVLGVHALQELVDLSESYTAPGREQ
jgi:hypothetical protein